MYQEMNDWKARHNGMNSKTLALKEELGTAN